MKEKRRERDAASPGDGGAKKRKRADAAAALDAEAAPSPARCPAPARQLPPHQLVLAPMVGGSELPFRLLARRHGAELCYTPMLHAARFCEDAAYREAQLRGGCDDAPLVVHFCGNEPEVLVRAGWLAARRAGVVAIDINLGCPQRAAHSGNFGAYLCATDTGRATALSCVRAMAAALPLPVFAKIRLQDELADTLAFCRQLREAGVALLAVHARYRGSPTHRRDGPAHLEAVRAVKEALPDLPVLSNGNVREAADVLAALRSTGADGVMSAEGALDDPALFARAAAEARRRRKRLRKALKAAPEGSDERAKLLRKLEAAPRLPDAIASEAPPPSRCALAMEYMELVMTHGGGPSDVAVARFHVRRMCREQLGACRLVPLLDAASSLEHVAAVARRCAAHEAGDAAAGAADDAVLAALTAAAAAEKRNAARRAEFTGRMRRKARREGKPDDFYERQGADPPGEADVAALRRLDASQRLAWWGARFGQHCIALHAEGRCARAQSEHGCAYLHVGATPAAAAEPLSSAPTWLLEKDATGA